MVDFDHEYSDEIRTQDSAGAVDETTITQQSDESIGPDIV
jgi:hypothetical protein